MKTYIFYLFIFSFSLNMFSQHSNRERIKAQKTAFITNRLDLTPKEAQKFWPIYNAFDESTMKIKHQDMQNIRKEIKDNLNSLSQERSKELLDKMMNAENELHIKNTSFIEELKKIISPKKIILLKIAEKDFHRILLKQFKKKHPLHRPE